MTKTLIGTPDPEPRPAPRMTVLTVTSAGNAISTIHATNAATVTNLRWVAR